MAKIPEEIMELHLWGGGWGLPSIDPESLQCLAAVRFGGAPTKVIECNNPWKSPKASIPFLRPAGEKGCLYAAHDVGTYLRSKNFSPDYGLSSKQCAETVAYAQYVWDSLHVAYLYFFWVHELNYNEIVRPFYGRRLPWSHKFWYPDWRIRTPARDVICSIYRDAETQPESVQPFIVEKAKKCIQLLSEKLGKNEFFMGSASPTTMDAIVFSYLAVFWKVQLPVNPLKEAILSSSQLEVYLSRILRRHFPVTGPQQSVPTGGLTYGPDGEIAPVEEAGASTRHRLFAGAVASGAMLLYAYKNGMVRLPGNSQIDASQEDEEDYWE